MGKWERGTVGKWNGGNVGKWESGNVRKWESGRKRSEAGKWKGLKTAEGWRNVTDGCELSDEHLRSGI